MRKILLMLSVSFVAWSCDTDNNDHLPPSECSIPATVKNLSGLDGCGYVFQLNNGAIIEPYRIMWFCGTPPLPKEVTEDPLYGFHWADGKKVRINYDVIDSMTSTCMAGEIAKITCIQDLEPDKKCIEYVIDRIESEAVRNPPAVIYGYTLEGNKYYYIPAYCCDFPSTLLDEQCNIICYPDGGITGESNDYCSDFMKQLKNPTVIWTDDRVKISD